jgi:hypothetical protein
MKSVVMLWECLLSEVGTQYHVRTDRDLAYARRRLEHEGESFLTISLPLFEKDLTQAFASGKVHSDHFSGFKRSGGLPTFLSGFLREVFTSSGVLRSNVDYRIVKSLRQVLLFLSKIEAPTTLERQKESLNLYIKTDTEVGEWDEERLLELFSIEADLIFGSLLRRTEHDVWSRDWAPRHSSGATADRVSYNSKFRNNVWTERLQEVLPYWDDLIPNYRWDSEVTSILPPEQEPPVRVALVPKTMKAPRIIAMEPVWTQYVQQGVLQLLTKNLRSYPILNKLMGWTDQEPNRLLSKVGSLSGEFATLDLSEASDRVSNKLVLALFKRTPYLGDVVQAARSPRAEMPNGEILELNKFASMGSSLTFPIESMVFHTLISLACKASIGGRPGGYTRNGIYINTRVFGDDLIVPSAVAQTLADILHLFGMVVNQKKSFSSGPFRESCGSDWFNGKSVSVVKMRRDLPRQGHHVDLLESAIDLQRRLFKAGYVDTSKAVSKALLRVFPQLPKQPSNVDVPALIDEDVKPTVRFSKTLHRPEYRGVVFRRLKPLDPLDGFGALQKYFSPHGLEPREGEHLLRDGRSRCVGINIGWMQEANNTSC